MNNKLILRALTSPFVTPYNDITKASVLSHADVDNNFIFLKGEIIYSATTDSGIISLKKLNGDEVIIDISNLTGGTSSSGYITGGTYSNGNITFTNNSGYSFTVTGVTSPDTYVTGATVNNSTKQYTFKNNTGGTFVVNGLTDISIASGIYNNGVLTLNNSTGGTVVISGFSTGTSSSDIYVTGITNSNNVITLKNNTGGTISTVLNTLTGLTINGTLVTSAITTTAITVNSISATTYLNLPTDVKVTGGTYSSGVITFTNNTGGTFTVTGLNTGSTDVYVTGGTYSNGSVIFRNNTGGTFTVNNFYTGGTDVYVTGATVNNSTKQFTFVNNTGGTFNLNGLTDITITSGIYNSGNLILTNTTGGTITITGLTASAGTDTYVTGGTPNNSTKQYTFTNNIGSTFNVIGLTDLNITGGTYSNGSLVLSNNTGGTFTVTGFSTGSTSAIITGGTPNNSTKQYTFTNSTGGTFVVTALTDIFVTGGTYSSGVITFTNTTGGTFQVTGLNTGTGGTISDTYVTGGTPNNSTKQYTFTNNSGVTFNVVGLTNITITGATTNNSTKQFTFTNNTGGTIVLNGLTDITITGGTYNSGTATFVNNTGGTFQVTGFNTGSSNIWTSGSSGNFSIKAINNSTIDATGSYAVAEGDTTKAYGYASHAEGFGTIASGTSTHTEGSNTIATGTSAHAEGDTTKAYGYASHAEGNNSIASGNYSHTEGSNTIATGTSAHAEGDTTKAYGDYSHAEGSGSIASGYASHAEGINTTASGNYSHAEGSNTIATGTSAHAEGSNTIASYQFAHAEGFQTIASGSSAHAEGTQTIAGGDYSHAEGYQTKATNLFSHAEGDRTIATGTSAHAEGTQTKAYGDNSHAEGSGSIASGYASHAEGINTTASGNYSHAEGQSTASGTYSHAEGFQTIASGSYSHVEGFQTIATGTSAHAEGTQTKAYGDYSHAEGSGTTASGNYSHAEGSGTIAFGTASHAGGQNSIASGLTSFVYSQGSIAYGNNSAILGGRNISGFSNDTTYVPFFSIQSASTDNTLTNVLVRDTTTGDIKLRVIPTGDTYVTGGTPNNSTKQFTFTNSTGGTFVVTALTDITITGGTYSSGSTTLSLVNNTGGTISITGFSTGGSSSGWALDGNTVGSLKAFGTNDNFDIPFETNGSEKARLMTNGRLGINTTTPMTMLDIRANANTGGLYVEMPLNVGEPAIEVATMNSLGLSIIGGGSGIDVVSNSTGGYAFNATSQGAGTIIDSVGIAGSFTSRFSNAGLFAQTGMLTGNNGTDTVAIYRNFSYTGNGITGFTASGAVLNINDDTYSQGPLLRITKRNVDRFVILSGGILQYNDGNQGNGKVLTSDANGNASWQTVTGGSSGTSYTFSTGLTNSGNTVTANLSTGVAGGQSVIGGTAANNALTLSSTSNASKGKIYFGTASTYNEFNDRLGIGTTFPGARADFWTTNGSSCVRVVNSDATTANSGNIVGWYFSPVTNGANTNMPLYEQYSSSSVTMRVNFHAGGNVTIGNGSGSGDAKLHVIGNIKIQDGTQGNGKVLTSDANGLATWSTPTTGFSNPMTTIGDIIQANTGGTPQRLAGSSTVGTYLRSGGSGALNLWSTLVLPNTAANGNLFFATSSNVMGSSTELTYTSAFGYLALSKTQDGTTYFQVTNSDSTGTTAAASLAVISDTAGFSVTANGSANTNFGGGARVILQGSGIDMNIVNTGSVPIKFSINTTTEILRIAPGGVLIGIGTASNPDSACLLDLNSTSKGLRIPRGTTAQRTAITTTSKPGILFYDTDLDKLFCTNNTGTWVAQT